MTGRQSLADLLQRLYLERSGELEDSWGRRHGAPTASTRLQLFGRGIQVRANHPSFLEAAESSRTLFSDAAASAPEVTAWLDGIVHGAGPDPGAAPDDLAGRALHCGEGSQVWIGLEGWGWARADLETRRASAIVHQRLARHPELLARCLLHTLELNLLIAHGMGLLHAACLVGCEGAVLLLGAHGVGKSTAAMELVRAGLSLLTESMVFVDAGPAGVALHGFPVGHIKLRADVARRVLAEEPGIEAVLTPEEVRGETKYVLDLARWRPDRVVREALRPARVHLCLVERHGQEGTVLQPLSSQEVAEAVFANSLFYDSPAAWEANNLTLARLLADASCHRLCLGTGSRGMVAAVMGITGGERGG